MANNQYNSMYSKIKQDPAYQSVNPHMKKELTVEEYYDLLHHTHDGMANGEEVNSKFEDLTSTIDELTSTINELKAEIDALKQSMDADGDGEIDSNGGVYIDTDNGGLTDSDTPEDNVDDDF